MNIIYTCTLAVFYVLLCSAQRIKPIETNADFDIYKIVRPFERVELTCRVKEDYISDSTPIQWKKLGQNEYLKSNDDITVNGETLTISKFNHYDPATYLCVSTYNDYPINGTIVLAFEPNITVKGDVRGEGKPLELKCNLIYGNPKPKVSWDINGTNHADSTDRIKLIDEDGVENAILRIEETRKSDEGVYKCIANNVAKTTIADFTVKFSDDGFSKEHIIITSVILAILVVLLIIIFRHIKVSLAVRKIPKLVAPGSSDNTENPPKNHKVLYDPIKVSDLHKDSGKDLSSC